MTTISAVGAALVLATAAVGAVAEHGVAVDRAIDAPEIDAAGAQVHPVWRLDRMGGESLEILVERGLALPDAERRVLVDHLERTADRVAPFGWRERGVSFDFGCHPVPDLPCPLGVAVPTGATTRIVLSPLATYLTAGALETVIAHELAHVWQFSLMPARPAGSSLLGLEVELPEGVDPAELEADCLAVAWGFGPPAGAVMGYWECPPSARIAAHTAWRAAPLD
jgi:hypothetical protein